MVQLNTTAGSENYNCAQTKIIFVTTTYLELLFRATLVLNRIALTKFVVMKKFKSLHSWLDWYFNFEF